MISQLGEVLNQHDRLWVLLQSRDEQLHSKTDSYKWLVLILRKSYY